MEKYTILGGMMSMIRYDDERDYNSVLLISISSALGFFWEKTTFFHPTNNLSELHPFTPRKHLQNFPYFFVVSLLFGWFFVSYQF